MPDAKKQGRSNKAMTFFVCFLAALAGLLFGLDIGVIAGALPFIADEFQITSHTQEWVVSSMMFGTDSFPRSAGAGGGCGLLYRTTVPVRNCAGKNSRQYDLDVSVDDHYRDPRRLSF